MLKVVIDTNVFISGLIKSPSCRKIIKAFAEAKFNLVISPQTLDELLGVISRPKFHNLITRETAEKLIETIKTQAILVRPTRRLEVIKDDPTDNRFLEAAFESKADFIVSEDKHLLSATSFHPPIVTPTEFLKQLNK